MGLLILGVNTVYIAFCFIRTLAMVGKGLSFMLNYSQKLLIVTFIIILLYLVQCLTCGMGVQANSICLIEDTCHCLVVMARLLEGK